jgi:hypothetical protein
MITGPALALTKGRQANRRARAGGAARSVSIVHAVLRLQHEPPPGSGRRGRGRQRVGVARCDTQRQAAVCSGIQWPSLGVPCMHARTLAGRLAGRQAGRLAGSLATDAACLVCARGGAGARHRDAGPRQCAGKHQCCRKEKRGAARDAAEQAQLAQECKCCNLRRSP